MKRSNRARQRALIGLTFCGLGPGVLGCSNLYWVCDAPDEARLGQLPQLLSETGLFSDVGEELLAPGVFPYEPSFALWSDGAQKRRWVWLPEGERIDTSDADDWTFPVGTKFWKEFTRDGVRVETRLLERWGEGQGQWTGVAYLWNADETDAALAAYGAQNAAGTPHDVPAASECMACHGGTKSVVLGFSAVQLAHEAKPGQLDLDALEAAELLRPALTAAPQIPGSDLERAALGYLHANCGHCHNSRRPERHGARCFDPDNELDFRLLLDSLESVSATPTLASVGDALKPGNPADSRVLELMSGRGMFQQMPPLATERVDSEAVALLSDFIRGLK